VTSKLQWLGNITLYAAAIGSGRQEIQRGGTTGAETGTCSYTV